MHEFVPQSIACVEQNSTHYTNISPSLSSPHLYQYDSAPCSSTSIMYASIMIELGNLPIVFNFNS